MIVFRNPGLIDMAAACTLGVSVKEGDSPIGRFGTGFKFGVATLLREGARIVIYRGAERLELGTKRELIRGKEFELVTLDGVSLGFTTQLGRDWKPWMAFRELACNALDEGGRFYSDMGQPIADADETMICVTGGGIEDAYNDRHEVLIEGEPLYANAHIEVRPGETNAIYFRGVKVGLLPRTMTHRYNILGSIDLTEDRTFKYQFEVVEKIGAGLIACDDAAILKRAMTCGEGYLEHHIDMPIYRTASPAFDRIAADLRGSVSDMANANPSALRIAEQKRLSELGPDHSIPLNDIEQASLDRAVRLLSAAGYAISDYPIMAVESLGKGVHGMAKEGRIFIARAAFMKGTREIAATLFEEYAHLRSGASDCTREFQNWLFDQLLCRVEADNQEAF